MINIYEEVKDYNSIAISGHIKPDGDCIGSCLGLFLYLKKRLPEKKITVFLQEPAYAFRNIPGREYVNSKFDYDEENPYEVFIALDTVPSRMGEAEPIFQKAKKTINIDHHISNANGSGMVNYVVPEASATAELVVDVVDFDYMDADIAELLYMGIAHDTGVFKYSNTSADTLRIVAKLMGYGFDFPKLIDETFYEKTYLQNKMQSLVVLDSKLYFNGRLIIGVADRAMMKQHGAEKNDFEGVVNQLRITSGVECAVFMYEKEPGIFKVSLRATSDLIDVAKVTMTFGGGGHVRAAGCDLEGPAEDIIAKLIAEIGKQLI